MWTFQTSRASPEVAAAFAPQAAPAADAPAACSDISDTQLLALTDTTSLTADQLDRRHHLLRHSLPDGVRGESVLVHFEAGSVHEAVKLIKKMSQRDLQAKFRLVYGAKTFSNNNNWLRRKLFEAIGVDPAKGAVKKAAGGGAGAGGRRRRAGGGRGSAAARAPRAPRLTAATRVTTHAASSDWFAPRGEYRAARERYDEEAAAQAGWAEVEDDEDHGHACEALLALGEAATSLDESCSAGSPGASAAAAAGELPDGKLKEEEEAEEEEAGDGAAAFRRLLLEQHERRLAAEHHLLAMQQHLAGGAAMAEWLAAVQQHAAAMHPLGAAAMAGLLPPHHPAMSGWPGTPMLPLFQASAVQQGVMGVLGHAVAASPPPLFATGAR